MSTSAIGNVSSSNLQQVLASALQSAGITANSTGNAGATAASQSDSSRLSPSAQLANSLQQLQESNPTKYKQVTQQVAMNLQSAAQTAQSQGIRRGKSTHPAGGRLHQRFRSGQLPNLQDLRRLSAELQVEAATTITTLKRHPATARARRAHRPIPEPLFSRLSQAPASALQTARPSVHIID